MFPRTGLHKRDASYREELKGIRYQALKSDHTELLDKLAGATDVSEAPCRPDLLNKITGFFSIWLTTICPVQNGGSSGSPRPIFRLAVPIAKLSKHSEDGSRSYVTSLHLKIHDGVLVTVPGIFSGEFTDLKSHSPSLVRLPSHGLPR